MTRITSLSYVGFLKPIFFYYVIETDYSSGRRIPSVKLGGQNQGTTTTNTMPTSTSLQDINSNTHKFNWNKDQPLLNLPE